MSKSQKVCGVRPHSRNIFSFFLFSELAEVEGQKKMTWRWKGQEKDCVPECKYKSDPFIRNFFEHRGGMWTFI